jgi:hypothetical protein
MQGRFVNIVAGTTLIIIVAPATPITLVTPATPITLVASATPMILVASAFRRKEHVLRHVLSLAMPDLFVPLEHVARAFEA